MKLEAHAPGAIDQAVDQLRAAALVALSTETVYGLADVALNDTAVARIYAAKGRPADHPLIVHLAPRAEVRDYAAEVPEFAQRLIDAFWPGPLTLILPRRPGVAAQAAGGQASIGLRCPSHPVAQAVLQAFGRGLAAPSANRFGRVSPTTAAHVEDEFGPDLLVLDAGPCEVGIESTIVDCTRGAPVLLRPGVITRTQIEAACGQALATSLTQVAPRASGTLESHYAPRARVRLLHAAELAQRLKALADEDQPKMLPIGLWSAQEPPACPQGVLWRQQASDAGDAAHQLFAVLRELDARGVAEIWVEQPPAGAEWDGVRDRLQRAAA